MKRLIIIPAFFFAFFTNAQTNINARIRELAGEFNKKAPLIQVKNLDSVEKRLNKKNISFSRSSFSYSEDENAGSWGGSKTCIHDIRKPFVYYNITTNIFGGTIIEMIVGSDAL